MLPNFFRTYKNKDFKYMPLYYNQQKEELQSRVSRIEKEVNTGVKSDFQPGIIRGSFRNMRSIRAKADRGSALRIVIIVLLLLGLVYYVFNL